MEIRETSQRRQETAGKRCWLLGHEDFTDFQGQALLLSGHTIYASPSGERRGKFNIFDCLES